MLARTHPTMQRKVFIVGRDSPERKRLEQWLRKDPELEPADGGEAGEEALAAVRSGKAGGIIINVTRSLSDACEFARRITRERGVPIVMYSDSEESEHAERAIAAGARGYVLKSEPFQTVLTAVRIVMDGGIYVSNPVRQKLFRAIIARVEEKLKDDG